MKPITRHALLALAVAIALPLTTAVADSKPANVPHYLASMDDKDKDKDDKKNKKPNALKEHAEELDTIADLLDGLLSPDGPAAVLPRIAENDRQRLTDDLTEGREKYVERVNAFRETWHQKYDDNFNANNHKGILSADRIERTDRDGTHYATVFFEPTADKPAFQLHLLRGKDGKYTLDLPDSVKGRQFMSRLDGNLKDASDGKDDWPKAQSQAYARAAHQLLFAFRYEEVKPEEDKN